MIVSILQIASAVAALAAAALWFWAAATPAPPATYEGIGDLPKWFGLSARRNQWAASAAGLSALLAAAATCASMMQAM